MAKKKQGGNREIKNGSESARKGKVLLGTTSGLSNGDRSDRMRSIGKIPEPRKPRPV